MARKKSKRRNGEGQVIKKGSVWAVRYREHGVRKYSGGWESLHEAEQERARIHANIKAERPGVPAKPEPPSAVTFGKLVEGFHAYRATNRTAKGRPAVQDDVWRWDRHLAPVLNHRTPDSISGADVDRLVRALRVPPVGTKDTDGKRKKAISPATAQRVVHLLSAFYQWANKDHPRDVKTNPVRGLIRNDQNVRALLASTHDRDAVPFLKTKVDITNVFKALPSPVNIAFAIGALAGFRPGEVLALKWTDLDLDAGKATISRQVRQGKVGAPKSGKPREVPLVPSLVKVLTDWKEQTTGDLVIPAYRVGTHLGWKTIDDAMTAALKACKLPTSMTFYQCTRHTFASQWVLEGLSIYRLSKILGHASVVTTERYAHLTNKVSDAELQRADVQLAG